MADDTRLKVIDGDTVEDQYGNRIRVPGVNTPESTARRTSSGDWVPNHDVGGWQATENAERLLRDGGSLGEKQGETYGRDVRSVITNRGTTLSDEQLSDGLGTTNSYSSPDAQAASLNRYASGLRGDPLKDDGDYLRESVRSTRHERFRSLVNGRYPGRGTVLGAEDSYGTEGAVSDAWERGKAELRMTGNAFLEAVGSLTGHDPLREYGQEGVQRAIIDSLENPARVSGIDDIESLADVGMYLLETGVAEAPGLLMDAGIAAAGAATGGTASLMYLAGVGKAGLRHFGGATAAGAARDIVKRTAVRGAKTGAFGSMYVQNTGESYMEQQSVGIDDPLRAGLVGGAKTALDYASLKGILGDVADRFSGGESIDSLSKWFTSTLGTMTVNGGREGVTELTQTLIDELNKVDLTDGEYQVDGTQLLESLVAGTTVGTTLSGAGAAAGNTYQFMVGSDRDAGAGPDDDDSDPEGPEDLGARIEANPNEAVYVPPSNLKDDVTAEYLAERFPNLSVEPSGDGGVYVSQSPEAVREAPKRERRPKAEAGAETQAGQDDTRVLVEEDNRGRVIRETEYPEPEALRLAEQATSEGRRARVTDRESFAEERSRRYASQVEALRRNRPNPGTNATAGEADYQTSAERRAVARFEFADERPVADIEELAAEARELGIDTEPLVRREPVVNENVLRRELQSMLGEQMPGRDATLRDALDGRKLADLDVNQLRQIAQAMGVKDLPKKAKAFSGRIPARQQRTTAINAVARKLLDWRDGSRRDNDGTWVSQLSPSDMSLMAGIVPELDGISRTEYDSAAAYQSEVRRVLNEAFPTGKAARQHLATLDDEQLIEAVQLTRADTRGLEFQVEEQEVADAGKLREMVVSNRRGEPVEAPASEARDLDAEWDSFFDVENPLEDVEEQQAEDPRIRDVLNASAVAAAYTRLTGQNEGASYRAAVGAAAGGLPAEAQARVRPSYVDGGKLIRRLVEAGDGDEQRGLREQQMAQVALDSPTAFAEHLLSAVEQLGIDLAPFVAEPDTNRRAGQESARASGFPNTRLQDRSEQESSDFLFFVGLLEGARFDQNEAGEVVPATPIDPRSDSPKHRQGVESSERTQRLDGANLVSLTVRTRDGGAAPYLFDLAAMAEYGQSGESRPETPAQAYANLQANLSRLTLGPQTAAHQPSGENPTFVQGLAELAFVPEHKVVWEGTSGPVTFGEARKAYYDERSDNQLRADLARELDGINERQSDRRRGLRLLVERMLNGLEGLEGEARLATIKDLNDALRQTDYDAMLDPDLIQMVVERYSEAELSWTVTRLGNEVTSREQRVADLEAELPVRQEELSAAREELDSISAGAETTLYVTPEGQRKNDPQGAIKETLSLAKQAVAGAASNLRALERDLTEERDRLARAREFMNRASQNGLRTDIQAPDFRNVDQYKSIASRFALSEEQAARLPGTQGATSFNDLLSHYRRERGRATAIARELDRLGRLPSYTDLAVDEAARWFMDDGHDRDTAYDMASQLAERVRGAMGSEAGGRSDTEVRQGDFEVDGQQMVAAVDAEGNQHAAPVEDENADERDRPGDDHDPVAELVYESFSFKRTLRENLRQAVENFKGAVDQRKEQLSPQEARQAEARVRLDIENFQLYGDVPREMGDRRPTRVETVKFASEAHELAYQKMQAAKKAQAHGIPQPETSRPEILHRAFGDKGLRVIGAQDEGAVEAFVTQAASDFRSTGRPVLVTVGENADQISQHLQKYGLLRQNQRKHAVRKLKDAEAGQNALYMPMGDFVLVSLPAQPKRGRAAANARWYHQLGHELGHMVFDDYAQSLASNRVQRDAVYAAFEAQTELKPTDDPALFKEWFADQAANEMIDRALGMADPEQVTPFTRLANLMRGLWERIQYLLPRFTRTRAFSQFAQSIREGQTRRRENFDATDDFDIEFYEGPTQAEINQTNALNMRAKAFAKKHTAPGTTMEALSRFARTVVGRIEAYSPELASYLFQRSANDRNLRGTQAYDQMANAKRDQWVGVMERAFEEVYKAAGVTGVFQGKAKQQAVIDAFRDFEAGRTHKRGAAALARAHEAVVNNARQSGFRSMILDPNSPPVAFDHHRVDADRQAFSALMREAFPEASDAELGKRLELLLDSNGHSEFAIAPGLPVSYHDTTRHMVDALGVARLREAGFLTEPSDAVFYHFIDGLAKRTAWEANFGGYSDHVSNVRAHHRRLFGVDDPNGKLADRYGFRDSEGRYYNPNARFNEMMDKVVAEHGQQARQDIINMLDGVMGRTTSSMPRGIRNLNDWVTAWTSWTILLFSGVASIPEVGLPAVRAHGRVGLLDGVKGYAEARRFAKAAGNVLSDSAERIVWQTMGDNYESSTLNKIGTAFFKLNGQKAISDVARTMGISIGTQYLLRSAEVGDTQALEQLGVTAEDVRNWDNAGRPVWTAGADDSTNATAEKVQNALTQFMYEGSSYPSKFQNPGWFNNPYLKMFWMVKRYMYAYGEGIILGMWRQMKRQWVRGSGLAAEQRAFLVAAPMLAFAVATIPLAAAGNELREWMRPLLSGRPGRGVDDHGGVAQYSQYLFSRAGGLGPLEVVLSMRQQAEWGRSLLGSTSPVIGKLEMLFDWGADGSLSAGEAATKLRQLIPVASQTPGLFR